MDFIAKDTLRSRQLDRRRNIPASDRKMWDDSIAERAIDYLEQTGVRSIHVFKTLKSMNEIDTMPIIEWAVKNRIAAFSTLRVEGQWRIVRFLPDKTYKLEDPKRIGAILFPLLAFDDTLHRLGYGGGYYDRLSRRYPKAVRMGLAYANQQVDELPAEEHDVPLQMVVTEKRVYKA